jgi:hypothetical protein
MASGEQSLIVSLYDFDCRPDFQVTARPLDSQTTEPPRRTLDAVLNSDAEAEPWCTWQVTSVGIRPPAGRYGKASLLGVRVGDELVSVRGVKAAVLSGADLQQLLQSNTSADSTASCSAVFRRSAASAAAGGADVLPSAGESVEVVQATIDCIVKRRTKRSHDGTFVVAVTVQGIGDTDAHSAGAERVVVTVDALAEQQELVRIAVYALIRREYVLTRGLTADTDSSADSDTEAELDAAVPAAGAFSAYVNNAVKGASFQAHLQELLAKQLQQRTAELLSQQMCEIVPAECVREEVIEPEQLQSAQLDEVDAISDAEQQADGNNSQHSGTAHNEQNDIDADIDADMQIVLDSSSSQHGTSGDADADTQPQLHSSSSSSTAQHSTAAVEEHSEAADEQPADSDIEQQQQQQHHAALQLNQWLERSAAEQHSEQHDGAEQHIGSDAETEQQGGTDTEQRAAAAERTHSLDTADADASDDELAEKPYVLPESECLVLWLYRYRHKVQGQPAPKQPDLRTRAKAAVMPISAWYDSHVQKVVVQGVPKNAGGDPLKRIKRLALREFEQFLEGKPFTARTRCQYDAFEHECAQKGITVEDTISAGEFSEQTNRALRRLLPAIYFSGWQFAVRELKPKQPRTDKAALKLQQRLQAPPRKLSKEERKAAAAAARHARTAAARAQQAAVKQAAAEASKAAAAQRKAAAAAAKKAERAAQRAEQRPCLGCDRRVQRFCYLCGLCLLQHCRCTAGSAATATAAAAAAATATAADTDDCAAVVLSLSAVQGLPAPMPLPPSARYTASSEQSVLRRLNRWHNVTTKGDHVSGSSNSNRCDTPPPAQGLLQWIHLAAATQTEFEPSMCGSMAPSALVAVGVIVEELLAETLRPIVRLPLEQQQPQRNSSSSSSSAAMLAERGYKRFKGSSAELEREVAVQARFPSGVVMPPARPSLQCIMHRLQAVYGATATTNSRSSNAAAAQSALSEAAVQAALQQCVLRPPLLLPLPTATCSSAAAEGSDDDDIQYDSAADEALQHVPLLEYEMRSAKRKAAAMTDKTDPIAAANAQWASGYPQSEIAFSGLRRTASESVTDGAHQADTSAAAAAAAAEASGSSEDDYDGDAAAAGSDNAMEDADTLSGPW